LAVELDHLILATNDVPRSIAFYRDILGLRCEGEDGPFSVVRVTPSFVILLAPGGTGGGQHLAFAMSEREFHATSARMVDAGIAYGDRFDTVGNMRGPSDEMGSRGVGKALYFFDPDEHLLEIRYYESD
jgi:catechol 2,3-dioxygenase-like lactoylglutathione lyase family enzyme